MVRENTLIVILFPPYAEISLQPKSSARITMIFGLTPVFSKLQPYVARMIIGIHIFKRETEIGFLIGKEFYKVGYSTESFCFLLNDQILHNPGKEKTSGIYFGYGHSHIS